jgi:hypothetical protein
MKGAVASAYVETAIKHAVCNATDAQLHHCQPDKYWICMRKAIVRLLASACAVWCRCWLTCHTSCRAAGYKIHCTTCCAAGIPSTCSHSLQSNYDLAFNHLCCVMPAVAHMP